MKQKGRTLQRSLFDTHELFNILTNELPRDLPYSQRWREGRARWRAKCPLFDPAGYEVVRIDRALCASFVGDHHYSASFPVARLCYGLLGPEMGLLMSERLCGVAALTVPVNDASLTNAFPDLVPNVSAAELGRLVLLDRLAYNAESWFLRRVFGMARQDGVRGLVAFSDPVPRFDSAGACILPGHVGQVYQSTNALYAGRSTAQTKVILCDGTELSGRTISKIRDKERGHAAAVERLTGLGVRRPTEKENMVAWLEEAIRAIGRRVRHPGCHRYLFPLGSKAERAQLRIALPMYSYPRKE